MHSHAPLLGHLVAGDNRELAPVAKSLPIDVEQKLAPFALEVPPHEDELERSALARLARWSCPMGDLYSGRHHGRLLRPDAVVVDERAGRPARPAEAALSEPERTRHGRLFQRPD